MAFTPSENPITHPERESYTELRPFRFWCQKVLPLVYDDSLSYYELLCKVVDYLNKTMEDVDHMNTDMDTLYTNFQSFQEGTFRIYNELVQYVNNYFENLNVQNEINTKLDQMASDGSLSVLIAPLIPDIITDWLEENITPSTPVIDKSLSVADAGADAYETGLCFKSMGEANSGDISRGMNENIIDFDFVMQKGFHNDTNTGIILNDNVKETGYIPVVPNGLYTSNLGTFVKWYDEYKNFISSTPSADTNVPFNAPNNARYCILIVSNAVSNPYFRQFQPQIFDVEDWNTKIKNTNIEGFVPLNLFDKNICIKNNTYSTTDGKTLVEYNGVCMTSFIPVKPFHVYDTNIDGNRLFFYDANMNFIETINSILTTRHILIPANVYFMVSGFPLAQIDNVYIYERGTGIEEWRERRLKNLIDFTSDIIYHGFYNAQNQLVGNNSFNQTDFIPVDTKKCYSCDSGVFVNCYDAEYNLIGNVESTQNKGYIVPLPNTVYCRFIFLESNQHPVIYESGNYEEYSEPLLEGIKYTGFGDSITFRENWCRTIADEFGMLFTNCGTGSAPISGEDEKALWRDSKINAVIASDPDIVTILAGANDLTLNPVIGTEEELSKPLSSKNKDTFYGAYSYVIETLLAWKDTLRIVILGTTWAHNNGADYSNTVTYTDYSNASKNIAQYYGLPFVDLHGECGFNEFTMTTTHPVYSSDNIHPNYKGGNVIASLVSAKFKECFKYM